MKMSVGKWAAIVCIFTVGTVVGPLIVSVAQAAFAGTDRPDRLDEAAELVRAYTSRLPRNFVFLTIARDQGRRCGYEQDSLKDNSSNISEDEYTVGVLAEAMIERWHDQELDDAWMQRIAAHIVDQSSAFRVSFLRHCIEGTAFAPLCMKEVKSMGENVPRNLDKQNLIQQSADLAYCRFMDGVAARRHIPLAPRQLAKPALP